jgi:hypothetical protein
MFSVAPITLGNWMLLLSTWLKHTICPSLLVSAAAAAAAAAVR